MRDMENFRKKFAQFSEENNALIEDINELSNKKYASQEEYEELAKRANELNRKINKLMTSADWFVKEAIENYGYLRVGDQYAIESVSEYRGFKYVIALMSMGHRCGYIAIPKDHELYGKDYNELLLDCHGGLTYSDDGYPLDDGNWYIGFDCAHLGDGKDYDALVKYFNGSKKVMEHVKSCKMFDEKFGSDGEPKSFEYVQNEIYGLINQLLDDDKPHYWEDEDDDGKE